MIVRSVGQRTTIKAFETSSPSMKNESSEQLEQRVEQLNAAIADVRKQLEDLGASK